MRGSTAFAFVVPGNFFAIVSYRNAHTSVTTLCQIVNEEQEARD